MNKEEELIDRLIDLAFAEDIGDGDHTTLSCIPATAMGKSKLLIKETGILAGIEVAKENDWRGIGNIRGKGNRSDSVVFYLNGDTGMVGKLTDNVLGEFKLILTAR